MDPTLKYFCVVAGAGVVGILVCSFFGTAAERRLRRQYHLRDGSPLPTKASRDAWDSTARPFAVSFGIFGGGVVLWSGIDPLMVAGFAGFVFGAAFRASIGSTSTL